MGKKAKFTSQTGYRHPYRRKAELIQSIKCEKERKKERLEGIRVKKEDEIIRESRS